MISQVWHALWDSNSFFAIFNVSFRRPRFLSYSTFWKSPQHPTTSEGKWLILNRLLWSRRSRDLDLYGCFPKIVVPPNHPFKEGFPYIITMHFGVPLFSETPLVRDPDVRGWHCQYLNLTLNTLRFCKPRSKLRPQLNTFFGLSDEELVNTPRWQYSPTS